MRTPAPPFAVSFAVSFAVAGCWDPPARLGHRDGCASACPPEQLCKGTVCVDRLVEFEVPGTDPDLTFQSMSLATGADGNLWLTQYQAHRVTRMTPDGVQTSFTTPAWTDSGGPLDIVAGPDGNLWLTQGPRPRLARITPNGTITELPDVPGATGTFEIAIGGDRKVWFTARPGLIGRVNGDDTITTFPLPDDLGADPGGLCAGPDSNTWFTTADGVARITPAGAIARFNVPSVGATPDGITAGPDGNLWLTEYTAGAIARVTTSGDVLEHALPSPASPSRIIAGPDGNLWFTDQQERIGRMTPAGELQVFGLPPLRTPQDICVGSDGNLWFTVSTGKIVRLTMP